MKTKKKKIILICGLIAVSLISIIFFLNKKEDYSTSVENTILKDDFESKFNLLRNSFSINKEVGKKFYVDLSFNLDSGNLEMEIINPKGEVKWREQVTSKTKDKLFKEFESEIGEWKINLHINKDTNGKFKGDIYNKR